MHRIGLAIALVCSTAAIAAAGVTAGVNLGVTHAKADGNADADTTVGVFGRLGFTSRVGGQLELEKTDSSNPGVDIRAVTGLLVVALADGGRLMPLIVAGIGLDHAGMSYGSIDAHHIEGGLSLEYRADGGLTLGAGFRLGGRTIDSDTTLRPLADIALYSPRTLSDGEYRSAGVYAAVRF